MREDFGQGYFGDFVHKMSATITARTDGQLIGVWALNRGNLTIYNMASAEDPGYVLSYGTDGGSFGWYIEYFGATYDFDQYIDAGDLPITCYFTITRATDTVTVQIYSEAARTTLLDTLVVTGDTTTQQYVYGVINRGLAGTASGSLSVTNLLLNETTQCVAEAADTCNDDCTICLSQGGCEGSTAATACDGHCCWHSDNTCNTTAEATGGGSTGVGGCQHLGIGMTGGSYPL